MTCSCSHFCLQHGHVKGRSLPDNWSSSRSSRCPGASPARLPCWRTRASRVHQKTPHRGRYDSRCLHPRELYREGQGKAAEALLEDGLERLVLIRKSSDGPPQAAVGVGTHFRHKGNWLRLTTVMALSNTAGVMACDGHRGDHGDHARINPFADSLHPTDGSVAFEWRSRAASQRAPACRAKPCAGIPRTCGDMQRRTARSPEVRASLSHPVSFFAEAREPWRRESVRCPGHRLPPPRPRDST